MDPTSNLEKPTRMLKFLGLTRVLWMMPRKLVPPYENRVRALLVSYQSWRNLTKLSLQKFSKDCTYRYPVFENEDRTGCEAKKTVTSGFTRPRLFDLKLGRSLYYAGGIFQ